MAWDDTHKKCLIATLAQVEASGRYDTITAPDTLSLGIGQWTQGRAYDLLKRFPAGTDFGDTVNGWLAQGKGVWTTALKYQNVSATSRSALRTALASSTGRQIQDSQMLSDLESSYIPRCQELGLNPDSETEACMMLIVVMHRWGNYARILSRIVGGTPRPATLDGISNAIKAQGEWNAVGQRYNIAYQMISTLQTNGVNITSNPGDNSAAIPSSYTSDGSTISYVTILNDGNLYIRTNGRTIVGYPAGPQIWSVSGLAQANAQAGSQGAQDIVGPTPGGGAAGAGETLLRAMDKWLRARLNKYVYYQTTGRLYPDRSGLTDCSGLVWAAYHENANIDVGAGGTAEMFVNGAGAIVGRGSGAFNFPASQIHVGDLVICRWNSGGGHVEWCTGNGYESIGQRGPDGVLGPDMGSLTMFNNCSWIVKRYINY